MDRLDVKLASCAHERAESVEIRDPHVGTRRGMRRKLKAGS